MMSEKDEESKKRQSMFEAKLREMETMRANLSTSGQWSRILLYKILSERMFVFVSCVWLTIQCV